MASSSSNIEIGSLIGWSSASGGGGFLGPFDPVSLVEEGLLVILGATVSSETVGECSGLLRIGYEGGLDLP